MAERTMIERVARAIDAASDEVSMAFMEPNPLNDQNVQRCCDADRAKRLRQARAAIEAMREPTEEMTHAQGPCEIYDSRITWQVMIDAALKP